jgi:hypothetical protein
MKEGGYFSGFYKVWGKPKLDFHFLRNPEKGGDKAPDFLIEAKDPCGEYVQIGFVYENKIKDGDKAGCRCFSMFFQCEGLFKEPKKLAAFPDTAAQDVFTLSYSKERPQAAAGSGEYKFESEEG